MKTRTFLHALSDALEKGAQIEICHVQGVIEFRLEMRPYRGSLYSKMTSFRLYHQIAACDQTGTYGAKELVSACRRIGINIED